ncbi:DUF3046 domain-containing protein [Mycetocola tolaasinivorans]|uniref:DUF3046 domain-containing protein n=1 Tax=Mycetocola tolaasinivorans TaxID=76635 RepID=A0A3L7ABB4_9MICO|nr:DUF3046 domain-containing protein [Mycetocola tolaasinivorans]RLP77786.1 DUF3046 domain-containing protein [Mycetocola tolaasinivorans]
MKNSELRHAIAAEFGAGYGDVLMRDLALRDLGGRSGEDALRAGVPARDVWLALCRENDVPRERWDGMRLPTPRD